MRYTITFLAEADKSLFIRRMIKITDKPESSPLSFETEGFHFCRRKQRAEILFQKILVITVEICYNKDIL